MNATEKTIRVGAKVRLRQAVTAYAEGAMAKFERGAEGRVIDMIFMGQMRYCLVLINGGWRIRALDSLLEAIDG